MKETLEYVDQLISESLEQDDNDLIGLEVTMETKSFLNWEDESQSGCSWPFPHGVSLTSSWKTEGVRSSADGIQIIGLISLLAEGRPRGPLCEDYLPYLGCNLWGTATDPRSDHLRSEEKMNQTFKYWKNIPVKSSSRKFIRQKPDMDLRHLFWATSRNMMTADYIKKRSKWIDLNRWEAVMVTERREKRMQLRPAPTGGPLGPTAL